MVNYMLENSNTIYEQEERVIIIQKTNPFLRVHGLMINDKENAP